MKTRHWRKNQEKVTKNQALGGTREGDEEPGTGEEPGEGDEEDPGKGKQDGDIIDNNPELVVEAIKNESSKSTIVVDASSNKKIDKAIFEALKGRDKSVTFKTENSEWTFNGKDIKEVKDIDLTIQIASLKDTVSANKDAIAKKVKNEDVLVLSFASNGKLPAKATVRVKLDSTWLANKDKNNIFVYYYNPETKKAEVVAKKLKVDEEGYIQFAIDHNSDFFVADKDLVAAKILPKTGSPVDTQILSLLGLLVMATGLVVIFTKRKKFNK